jgi:hypothetical protein
VSTREGRCAGFYIRPNAPGLTLAKVNPVTRAIVDTVVR